MKSKISRSSIATVLPVQNSALAYFIMDYYKAPEFVWGIIITLFSIIWIACIYEMATEERIDVFEEEEKLLKTPIKNSRWMQRLEEVMKAKEEAKK
jgi:hypothetical protein